MPKLKNLSGEDVLKIMQSFSFIVASQKGSHLKLKRIIGEEHKLWQAEIV